ncbi:MAG: SDR family oxidoreductase [Planctomycetia bacterium]|nr:SDR family oxidoreductase [Planctomycetia bacterium]
MELGLTGQVAAVIGSAQGIGEAIARTFAAEGARVALIDRDSRVSQTAASIGGLAVVADVTDYTAIQTAAHRIKTDWGRVDHVIFAVGIGSGKFGFPFWNLMPSDWPKVFMVNVIGAANVAHAFAPLLIEARSGTMLFLSSVAGQIGSQTDPPYSASKAALINFAQCAAKDLAPYGVRVNTLCPGMVQTTLNRSVYQAWADLQPEGSKSTYEEWAGEKVRRVVPLGRWQTPEDIASMAVFLSSSRAANVTGQTVNVDGGFVMHW